VGVATRYQRAQWRPCHTSCSWNLPEWRGLYVSTYDRVECCRNDRQTWQTTASLVTHFSPIRFNIIVCSWMFATIFFSKRVVMGSRHGIIWIINFSSLYLFKSLCCSLTWSAFLQRAQCSHCKRCTSYGNSVCLSVCPSHAGIVSKRRHVAWCSLHCWIAKCV